LQQVAKALASDKKKAGFKNKKAQRKEKKGQAFPLPFDLLGSTSYALGDRGGVGSEWDCVGCPDVASLA